MANIHLLSDPPTDAGIFSGGSWLSGLPLANLKTQQPVQVARSTGLGAAATAFVVDMAFFRPISMFALVNTNLGNAASVRFRVSDSPDGANPALDVTRAAFLPNVAWGALPWGAFPWEGFRADDQPGGPIVFYKHTQTVGGRYVLIDIADPSNPAGYVQIGRFMAGEAFVPRFNFSYGAQFGFVDESRQSRSVGGQAWFDKKPKRRRFTCSFDALSEGEAYGAAYDLQRRVGLTGNLLLVYDPGDTPSIVLRRALYGSLSSFGDLVTANASVDAPYTWSLAIEELI